MANFTYNWQDGTVTSVPLSSVTGWSCDATAPDQRMSNAGSAIVAHAGDSQDLNEIENYCATAEPVLMGLVTTCQQITHKWDILEIECAKWDNWTRSCKCCMKWCRMKESALADAYYKWLPVRNAMQQSLKDIQAIWKNTSEQLALDNIQNTDLMLLNQLIAETNDMMAITTYNTQQRELDLSSKKTKELFVPVLIGLILLGLGFYLIKK